MCGCGQVLEHIQQPEKAIATLAQLLAPNGVLLMTTPFLVAYHANPGDQNRYTPSCVRGMLEQRRTTASLGGRREEGWQKSHVSA